jgi:hypothetical protein
MRADKNGFGPRVSISLMLAGQGQPPDCRLSPMMPLPLTVAQGRF